MKILVFPFIFYVINDIFVVNNEPSYDFDAQCQNSNKIFWGLLKKNDSKAKNFIKMVLYFPVILLILFWFLTEEIYNQIPVFLQKFRDFIIFLKENSLSNIELFFFF